MEWKKITELFTGPMGGIRRRLLWTGLLFLALALLINTVAGTMYTRVQIKKAAFEIQTEVASRVARRITGFIERKVERLLDFAASASLYEFGKEEQRLLALLLLKNDLSFSEVAVLNQNGIEVLKVSERRVYLPRELLKQGDHEKFRNAFGGRNYVGPVYTSEKAEPYVTVAVPIRIGPREIVGVVSAELNLKPLWQLVGDVGFGTAGYAYLVDSQGNLIAHKDPSLVLRRTNLRHIQKVREFLHNPTAIDPTPSEEKQGIIGKPALSTFAPVRGLGWGVILEEPVELALADVRRMGRYAFLLLGLGLLLGALVIVWVSDRITKPIREFHKGVEIIGSGNLDYRLEIRSGDEIEELAQEFNEMAGELKSLYSTLEQKVEQRTRELSALYDVTTNVNQTLEIEPVLQGVIKKITEVFGFDATRIFLLDGEMKELHLRASFETKPEFFFQARVFKKGQGNVGTAAETGEPIIYEDVTADPRYEQQSSTKVTRKAGCSFFSAIPIKSERRTLGTLVCIGRMPRRLTSEEMRLLTSMAGQIGVAVERASLFEETVKRARELSALYDVTATVNQSMEAGAVLQEVIARVLEIIGFDAARIYLLDPQAGELKLKAHQGISEDFASQTATDPVGVGINGTVLLTGKPAIFADIQTDPLYAERAGGRRAQEAGFHAYISLPLKSKTKTLGVMNFLCHRVRELSPKDIALLTAMAHQIGVAIENTSLYQQTAAKAQELSALYGVTATVSQSLDLNLVLQEVIKEITEIFHFDTMRIYLLDPQTDELHVRAHYPTNRGDIARVSVFRRGQGIVGRVAEAGEPMIFEDLDSDLRYRELSHTKNTRKTGHRFFAAFPIKTKLKPIGAIVCNGRVPRSLRSDEARLLASIANQIGVAVENATLFEESKRKSHELEALVQINKDIATLLDRQVLLPRIAEEARKILRVDSSIFRLLERDDLILVTAADPDGLLTFRHRLRLGESLAGKVVQENRALVVRKLLEDPRVVEEHREILRRGGYHSFLGVPLTVGERTIGSLTLYSKREREFQPQEITLMTAFANQAAIAIQNASLFAEVKNKTVELEKTNTDLQEANRAKADFLAAMSHELRTPLNVIIGNSDLLKDGFFGGVSDKQKDALDKVLRYSRNLLKLINDVLTLSRMEARRMSVDLSTFHMEEVLYHARTYVDQLNRGDRLEVVWQVEPGLPSITTDALKLEEILQNLIGNAFKFTREGKIQVRVRNLRGKDRIEFSVADTGIGIEEKDLGRIFEPFHQLQEAHTGSYSGVGLGLSIVKCYLDLMQGEIRVESQPGKGTKFTFTLPRSIDHRVQEAVASSQSPPV